MYGLILHYGLMYTMLNHIAGHRYRYGQGIGIGSRDPSPSPCNAKCFCVVQCSHRVWIPSPGRYLNLCPGI